MEKKIYFCGSIRGGRQDVEVYQKVVKKLKQFGTVLTEHVADPLTTDELLKPGITSEVVHERSMNWLSSCDIVVAEVTQPSLGVGYEIGRAVAMKKRVVCLFRPSSSYCLSCMIDGIQRSETYQVIRYEVPEIEDVIEKIFA